MKQCSVSSLGTGTGEQNERVAVRDVAAQAAAARDQTVGVRTLPAPAHRPLPGHIVTSIAETLAQHGQAMTLEAGDTTARPNALHELSKRRGTYGRVLILPLGPGADLGR